MRGETSADLTLEFLGVEGVAPPKGPKAMNPVKGPGGDAPTEAPAGGAAADSGEKAAENGQNGMELEAR